MARTIRKTRSGDLLRIFQEYITNRVMRERSAEAEDDYKAQMMAILEQSGELVEGGHRELPLDEPVLYLTRKNKKTVEKTVIGIRRTRRAQTALDETRTMAYLKRKGLLDRCTATVTTVVLDEDAILAANFDGTISDADLAALYETTELAPAFNLLTED